MKRIRIGNDIKVFVTIVDGGEFIELSGKKLYVFINSPYGSKNYSDFGISGNRIIISLPGASNNICGSYSVTIKLIDGDKQYLADSSEEWKLVDNTNVAGERARINTTEEVYINIDIGIISAVDYNKLIHKPSINKVELVGDNTLAQLGIQPAGNYATKEDIPDVSNFIEKIPGKGLSDNNFTNEDKVRIENIINELEKIKKEYAGYAKWFVSESALKRAIPFPNVGEYAWVGEPYPGIVYQCLTKGVWTNTGEAPQSSLSLFLDIVKELSEDELNDGNVLSSLRTLREITKAISEFSQKIDASFLHKDKPDRTLFLQRFLAGLHVGESVDSMVAGAGTIITENGRIQTDRIEVRHSMKVMELIINRLSAMEGDYSFSDSGTIEKVEAYGDNTYRLTLRKRWEYDFTSLHVNDIIYGMVNTLASGGTDYYTSWMRVIYVDTVSNKIDVTLYPDEEVPGGVNFAPSELMVITHRGNPVNTDRQSFWYLSSNEKCICMLDGVVSPKLQESNYSIIIGRLKQLSLFDNLPINYLHSYVYCRGIATQDIMQIDYKGVVTRSENNRMFWSLETAKNDPYKSTDKYYDAVSHYGCEWMCLLSNTLQEPKFGCSDWAMIRGNPEFSIELYSSNGWNFDVEKFDTTLSVIGKLYNQDVTSDIHDADITWTRDTGNVTEDNSWAIAHAESGKVLHLTVDDLGPEYVYMTGCKFTATALLRDGQDIQNTLKASMDVKVI